MGAITRFLSSENELFLRKLDETGLRRLPKAELKPKMYGIKDQGVTLV